MSRGSEARAALKAECEAAIEDIRRNGHQSACKAHDALARGQIVLLRCEIARLDSDGRSESRHSLTRLWSAIIALIVTVLVSWIQWHFWGK